MQAAATSSVAPAGPTRFRLIVTVKRGSAAEFPVTWSSYPTVEAARAAAATLAREERVGRIMIVRDEVPPQFVEWAG